MHRLLFSAVRHSAVLPQLFRRGQVRPSLMQGILRLTNLIVRCILKPRFALEFFLKTSLLLTLLMVNATAAISDITTIYRQTPSLQAVDICHGGGCAHMQRVALSDDEWLQVSTIFADSADSADTKLPAAEHERQQIAQALGVLESLIGIKTGTSTDRAGTFNNASYPGQLDCNDEAINTTSYLRLLRRYDLMKYHAIEDMRTRNFFFSGWPHTTAVIHEVASGERYAVDSWFYDNGYAATIVPFAMWKSGYTPTDSPIGRSRSVHKVSEKPSRINPAD